MNQVDRRMMVAHNDNLSVNFGYSLRAELIEEYPGGLAMDCGKKKCQR